MNGISKLNLVVITSALLFAPVSPALAAGYFGIGGGTFEENLTEEKDTALKVFTGVKFSPAFGLELAYIQLGEFSAGDPAFASADVEVNTLVAALVGFIPVGSQSAVFGKFGFNRWNVEGELCIFGVCDTDDESGTDPMFGVGLQFGLTDSANMRIEYEKFEADDDDLGKLLSLGVSFDL